MIQPLCGPGIAIAACKVAPILHVRRAVQPFQGWILDGWNRKPRQMPGLETGPLQGPARRRSRDHHSSTSGAGPGTRIQPIIASLALHRSPQSPSRRVQIIQNFQFIQIEVSTQPGPRPLPDHSECEPSLDEPGAAAAPQPRLCVGLLSPAFEVSTQPLPQFSRDAPLP